MLKKIVGSSVLASALATAAIVGTAGTAHAASASGGCTKSGKSGSGWVYYTYVSSSARDRIDKFTWQINGQAGSTKNDVILELKQDKTGSDPVLYSWSTPNATNGAGTHVPSQALSVPASYKTYGRFHFIIDINNADDPECTAETNRF
ncbi:hypothetical protein [Nonomuraea guangzhouensis]|uniref:Uncharacterized protein n=1 Tax=Nonomuraea guangzhouensis TaxID=1291555 RepID=A0ABW4GBN6_9ACTN|nr:hypothetical protein [Nonomuraea guangzhouensis]